MDKTMRLLCMATLVVMGTIITGCANLDENQQQEKNNLTLTTTLSFSKNTGTKTLTSDGEKTFALGDQVVLFYEDGKGISRRVLSSALAALDISADGKTANLTFDVSAAKPADNGAIRYVYPANMASGNTDYTFDLNDANTIDFTQLDDQEGTREKLGKKYDLCVFDGNFSAGALPASATLTNRLAILAITLTDNAATPADITSSITDLVVVEGSNHYAVNRATGAGPIYVAIKPTSSAVIEVAATDGANDYGKFLTSKTYAANNGYNVSWKMLPWVNLGSLGSGVYTYDVTEDMIITGTPVESSGFEIRLPNKECTVTLVNVDPTGSKSVQLNGIVNKAMTVLLKGTSRLLALGNGGGASVTIDAVEPGGTVIVTKTFNPLNGGPFIINGGTLKAKATAAYYAVFGDLVVNGGAVYLAGHEYSSTDYPAVSGTITGSLYGWGGSWTAVTSGTSSAAQYVTTDDTSGDPTAWTW